MTYLAEQKLIIEKLKQASANDDSAISYVPMSDNFQNDQKRCLTLLTYLPKNISNKVISVTEKLKSIEADHYYYPKDSLHLTIQNVRTVNDPPLFSAHDEKQADLAFQSSLKGKKQLFFQLSGLLRLRTSISIICYAEESYKFFVQEMRKSLEQYGIGDNKRYISNDVFFGNITICRFSKEPGNHFNSKVEALANSTFGNLAVSNLSLVVTNSICETPHTREINSYRLNS